MLDLFWSWHLYEVLQDCTKDKISIRNAKRHHAMRERLFKIARNGVITGDFTTEQIITGLASGTIRGSDHYFDHDLRKWRLVSEKNWQSRELKHPHSNVHPWNRPIKGLSFLNWSSADWKAWFQEGITRLVYKLIAVIIVISIAAIAHEIYDRGKRAATRYSKIPVGQKSYLSNSYARPTAPKVQNSQRKNFHYEVWCDTDREIFPSFEISFSKLNEAYLEELLEADPGEAHEFCQEKHGGTIGLRLFDVRKGDQYVIKVQSDGSTPVISESTYEFTADQSHAHSIAYPRLNFDYAQLRAVTQTRPINLKFTASRNGGSPVVVTQTWHLRQINDCPIAVRGRTLHSNGNVTAETVNIAFITFAGYVNENHPEIPSILDEALSLGRLPAFTGYQSGTNISVFRQLDAIWKVLEKRGIRYSNITTTTGSSTVVQHVRLIEDTLNTRQANCVDGSTLFASIATKIGLDTHLVLTPGHCYVAIDMPEPETKPIGIEMTALGRFTFSSAVSIATSKADYSLLRNFQKFDEGDISSGYMMIPIRGCREFGVQPIPAIK